MSNQSPQQQLPPYDPMASSRPIENTPRMRELAQNYEPNQSSLRKELLEVQNKTVYNHDTGQLLYSVIKNEDAYTYDSEMVDSTDAILDILIHALPERVFVTSLSGSATAEGYKLAVKDMEQLLLEAKGDK